MLTHGEPIQTLATAPVEDPAVVAERVRELAWQILDNADDLPASDEFVALEVAARQLIGPEAEGWPASEPSVR